MTDLAPAGVDLSQIDQCWPSNGLESVKTCPVCTSTERRSLHNWLRDRVFFCAPGEWRLYECQHCRSAYLDPRPTSETIHIAYRRYFTHSSPRDATALAPLTGMRQFRRALANGYRNWRYGAKLEPASSFGILVASLLRSQRRVVDFEFRHIPRAWPGARLLDVGAGNGAFLKKAISAGWVVAGAEPDPVALAEARCAGLDVQNGGIECFADEPASFDVITMSHVIEHLHEPREALRQAFLLLKPGGRLYVDTPNIESYGHSKFSSDWFHLDPPRHLVLLNWASLEGLLREVGFARTEDLVRTDVYPSSAARSTAIRKGKDPIVPLDVAPRTIDRLDASYARLATLLLRRMSEFVTIMAYKRK